MSNFPRKTVGQQFAEARAAKGWTLAEAARRTNLKPQLLASIEADEFDKLPSLSNARGFIRLYARELGLDGWALLRQFGGADDVPVDMLDLEPADLEAIPARSHTRASAAQGIGLALIIAIILVALGLIGYKLYTYSTFIGQTPDAPPASAPAPAAATPAPPAASDNIPVAKPVESAPLPPRPPTAPASAPAAPEPPKAQPAEPVPAPPPPAPAETKGLKLQLIADADADAQSRWAHVIATRDGKTEELFKDAIPAGKAFPDEPWTADTYVIILREAAAVAIIQNNGPAQKYELPGNQRIKLPVN